MNHTPAPTIMWQTFIDWVDTHRNFKHYDHTDLAKDFDPSSKVWFEQHGDDSFYDTYTCINFSDGTYVMFNYKGEVEESYDVPTTPHSSSSGSHFSVHNNTGDQP